MLPDAVAAHYSRQQLVAAAVVRAADRQWATLGADFDESWRTIGPRLLVLATAAQVDAATAGVAYVPRALSELNVQVDPEARVSTSVLAGVASDGRSLDSLLYEPVITTKTALKQGASSADALASGRAALQTILMTQVADAARVAAGLAIIARPKVGWVRMLQTPACSRCVVLAGKWFRSNQGFERHPRCDCRHIPAPESVAGDLTTSPKGYFHSLDEAAQDKAFTKAGAQAIRDGADIGQVVNARRGATGLLPAGKRLTGDEIRVLRGGRPDRGHLDATRVFGRDVYLTSEGTTVRGSAGKVLAERAGAKRAPSDRYRRSKAPRLMPESIYQIAGDDRAEAIRLLKLNGYLT